MTRWQNQHGLDVPKSRDINLHAAEIKKQGVEEKQREASTHRNPPIILHRQTIQVKMHLKKQLGFSSSSGS